MDNTTTLFNIIFLGMEGIIAAMFFIAGIYYLIRNNKEKNYTGIVTGKIINNIRREERVTNAIGTWITKIKWYSLCEYIVGETKCVRETNIGTLNYPKYKIGQTVTVHYNPNNCHESYIEGDNNAKYKAIVCLVLGVFFPIVIYFFGKMFF